MRIMPSGRQALIALGSVTISLGAVAEGAAQTAAPPPTPPNFIDTRPLPPTDRTRGDSTDARRRSEADARRIAAELEARKAADVEAARLAEQEAKRLAAEITSKTKSEADTKRVEVTKSETQTLAPAGVPPALPKATVIASAPTPMPVAIADQAEALRYLARGRQLLVTGDIIAARPFFERALRAGSSEAAIELGSTYDPSRLKDLGVVGLRPDPTRAIELYKQGGQMGATNATERLRRLEASR